MSRPLPAIRVKPDVSPRLAVPATPEAMDPALFMHLDTSSRFAPSVAEVAAVIRHARPRVRAGMDLLSALAASDSGNGIAAHYARRFLSRLCSMPFVTDWLAAPLRTRAEVVELLDKALAAFGARPRVRAGGWRVTRRPSLPTQQEARQ